MQNTRRLALAATAIVAAIGVAGCNTSGGTLTGGAIDGNWQSADGVTATRFSGGRFTTTVLATGETISNGTYRMIDGRTVQITMQSARRPAPTQVNCNLVTPQNLACAGADGQQFALVRRSA